MAAAKKPEGHGKCGAKTRTGVPCAKPAGYGTPNKRGRCKHHGGATPAHIVKANREEAAEAVVTYGLAREIDPHEALLEELHRTAGHVAWLGRLIADGNLPAAESPTGKARKIRLTQQVFGGGEQPSVWVNLYNAERKHFADVAKTCIGVGIEERRVKVAEQQGQLLAQVIRGIAEEMGFATDPRLPGVVRRHLTLVAGSA